MFGWATPGGGRGDPPGVRKTAGGGRGDTPGVRKTAGGGCGDPPGMRKTLQDARTGRMCGER